MANSNTPYTRDHPSGENAWNKLIRDINEVLQDPPDNTDCEPVDPLDEVDECHRWSVQDIKDAQNALKETCDTLEFTDLNDCERWRVSIVQELEDALLEAWCDCNPENLCRTQCSNAGPTQTTFITVYTVTDSACVDFSRECDFPVLGITLDALSDNTAEFNSLNDEWAVIRGELCILIQEVEDLEERVDELQAIKDDVCGDDPDSSACANATAQLEAKQAELDVKRALRDAKQIEFDAKETEVDAVAVNSVAIASDLRCYTEDTPFIDLHVGTFPAVDFYCEDKVRAVCDGDRPDLCDVRWSIQRRGLSSSVFNAACDACLERDPFPEDWVTELSGTWTPSGELMVTGSNGGSSLPGFFSASNNCGAACSAGCSVSWDIRIRYSFPGTFDPVCCNSNDPCIPGAPDQCTGGGPVG